MDLFDTPSPHPTVPRRVGHWATGTGTSHSTGVSGQKQSRCTSLARRTSSMTMAGMALATDLKRRDAEKSRATNDLFLWDHW